MNTGIYYCKFIALRLPCDRETGWRSSIWTRLQKGTRDKIHTTVIRESMLQRYVNRWSPCLFLYGCRNITETFADIWRPNLELTFSHTNVSDFIPDDCTYLNFTSGPCMIELVWKLLCSRLTRVWHNENALSHCLWSFGVLSPEVCYLKRQVRLIILQAINKTTSCSASQVICLSHERKCGAFPNKNVWKLQKCHFPFSLLQIANAAMLKCTRTFVFPSTELRPRRCPSHPIQVHLRLLLSARTAEHAQWFSH